MEREFLTLRKGDKTIEEYVTAFYEKLQFCGHLCPDEATTVTRFIGGLPADYRGLCRTKITMNEVIDEAKHIEDDMKYKAKKDGNAGSKRKFNGTTGSDKKFKGSSSNKGGNGQKGAPWCSSCKAYHNGACSEKTKRCDKCGKTGHATVNCRDKRRCYKCGSEDHQIAECPQKKNEEKKDNNPPKAKARAFQMTVEEARRNDEVVSGTFLVNSKLATVLFDSGANKSFVSTLFAPKLGMTTSPLESAFDVEIANGKTTRISEGYPKCAIEIEGHTFPVNLLPITLGGFDVVIGMDWMSNHDTTILCSKEIVRIATPKGGGNVGLW